jgi:hypothetical protein
MPNVTSFSGIYNLPAGRGHRFAASGIGNAILGGWSLNSILSLQSGMPVTVTQATNNNSFAGFSLQRANIVGNPKLAANLRSPAHYFNTAAFGTAPQFVIGSASRNPVAAQPTATSTSPSSNAPDSLKRPTSSSVPRCLTSPTRQSSRNCDSNKPIVRVSSHR